LQHNLVRLALHQVADGTGRPLLLLHGLGETSPAELPVWARPWVGPVYALDFTGHGQSTVPKGGGYTAEVLMGDADIALAAIGPATVVGRGLGAYVALPGLQGGGEGPTSNVLFTIDDDAPVPPDPWALIELSRDVRPGDYATSFARQALQLSGVSWPLAVCTRWRPSWLDAVASQPGVLDVSLEEAVAFYRDL